MLSYTVPVSFGSSESFSNILAIRNGYDYLFNSEGIQLIVGYKWNSAKHAFYLVILFHLLSTLALSDLTIELNPTLNGRTFASIIILGVLGGLSALYQVISKLKLRLTYLKNVLSYIEFLRLVTLGFILYIRITYNFDDHKKT